MRRVHVSPALGTRRGFPPDAALLASMRDLPPSRRGDLRLATGLRYPHRLVVGARGTLDRVVDDGIEEVGVAGAVVHEVHVDAAGVAGRVVPEPRLGLLDVATFRKQQ